ncbi:MAG: type II toxin-antitoxin system RelE/ParE family toxin [Elusimicrobia bacterium]|nr:type II toxin-antitoxin system RelE/ParE family toxin [Elusimicrobiota bacterium]
MGPKIGRALQYLEDTGHQAKRPIADYLGNQIYELRIPVDRHQHRLLYFFHGREIIVVAVGILKNEGRPHLWRFSAHESIERIG